MILVFLEASVAEFYTLSNKVEDISSPANTNSKQSVIKEGGVSTILGGVFLWFYMMVTAGIRSNQPIVSVQNLPTSTTRGTPKMSVLLKNSNAIKDAYFGKLGFLDNQAAFAEVFGDKPTILDTHPFTSKDTTTTDRTFFLLFFWSGLRGPKAYSLWGGVVPSPSIGYDYL